MLISFLETIVDRAVRAWLPAASRKTTTATRSLPVGEAWVAALHADDPTFSGSQAGLAQLHQAWRAWLEQLHLAVGQGFRISFRLEPPEAQVAPTQRAWGLRYFLQATDDLSLLIPAEEAWKASGSALQYLNRRFEQPQERLLAGLGLAARLFPPVEASLRLKQPEVARLTTDEAYSFLRETAPVLESAGFGVLVPPWWQKRGAANFSGRLKLKPKSAPKSAAPGKLTFDTLVDFDWQLALAGEVITPEEFRRLADLKTPLVQIRGEWVVLDPDAADQGHQVLGGSPQPGRGHAAGGAAPGAGRRGSGRYGAGWGGRGGLARDRCWPTWRPARSCRPCRRLAASTGACAPTRAAVWPGSRSCGASAWARAWRTTWDSAKRFRPPPCCSTSVNRAGSPVRRW